MTDEIKLASFSQRAGAYFIDMLIVMVVCMLIVHSSKPYADLIQMLDDPQIFNQLGTNVQVSAQLSVQMSELIGRFIECYVILRFIYMFVFLCSSGQTLGCLACSCRHVNLSDYGSATYVQALIKSVVFVLVDIFFNGILFLLAVFDKKKQTLADKSIKQVVIRV